MKTYASGAKVIPKEEWSQIQHTEPKWNKDKTRIEDPNTQPIQHDQTEIRIYTDGSCPENSKVKEQNCAAGWGTAIFDGTNDERKLILGMFGPVETKHDATHFKAAEYGSNNTGELTAICEGLLWTNTQENANPIAIYYDSKYAAKITTG